MTVHVLAFQHKTPGEGVGGFDWYYDADAAYRAMEENEKSGFYGPDYEYAVFEIDVSDIITAGIDAVYIDCLNEALGKAKDDA